MSPIWNLRFSCDHSSLKVDVVRVLVLVLGGLKLSFLVADLGNSRISHFISGQIVLESFSSFFAAVVEDLGLSNVLKHLTLLGSFVGGELSLLGLGGKGAKGLLGGDRAAEELLQERQANHKLLLHQIEALADPGDFAALPDHLGDDKVATLEQVLGLPGDRFVVVVQSWECKVESAFNERQCSYLLSQREQCDAHDHVCVLVSCSTYAIRFDRNTDT